MKPATEHPDSIDLLADVCSDPALSSFLCEACSENGFAVGFNPALAPENRVVIRVDAYYNSLSWSATEPTPPSPDCLIIVRCTDGRYRLYVVELKDVGVARNINRNLGQIREKFKTCLSDFMSNRFRKYFFNERYEYARLDLWFITNPYGSRPDTKDRGLRYDYMLSDPPLYFLNRKYSVQHSPTHPVVEPC
jgi:hypothetical protein